MKTKIIIYLILISKLFLVQSLIAQNKQDTLRNETVIMLHKKGISEGIIINKIKSSLSLFNLSTDALIILKDSGVTDKIVEVMIESSKTNQVQYVNINDPLTKQKPGIYYFNPNDKNKPLVRIDPTVVSAGKSGGIGQSLANSYTYGLTSVKSTSVISGPNAHKQIIGKSVVFYLYLENSNNSISQMGAMNWWFANASSPNEFALVKMNQKKSSREFDTGKANSYGSSIGIDEKQKIRFNYTEVSDGIFKITVTGDLASGEYCFIYTGSTPSMYSNDKVFDFGVL